MKSTKINISEELIGNIFYYNNYIFIPKTINDFNCKICNKQLNIYKKEKFIIKSCSCCNKSNYKAFITIFGENSEQYKQFVKNRSNPKTYKTRIYEENTKEQADILWQEYINKIKQNRQSFINRYGKVEGEKKYISFIENSKQTKENYIKRYGIINGSELWYKHIEKVKKRSNWGLNYWLEKCDGDFELATKKLKEIQNIKNKLINKYGKKDGIKKYNNIIKKHSIYMSKVFHGRSPSKTSIIFFDKLSKLLPQGIILQYGKGNEIRLFENNKCFIYDCSLNYNGINIIIEYNGDYWHANPKLYTENFIHPTKKIKAGEIWEYDKIKQNVAINQNYKILYIWEKDMVENEQKCLYDLSNKILEILQWK